MSGVLQDQCKGRRLCGALVRIETGRIVLRNQRRNVALAAALIPLHLVQQIHTMHKDMARA